MMSGDEALAESHLRSLCSELTSTTAHFNIDPSSLLSVVDALLVQLEELERLVALSRLDSSACLFKQTPRLEEAFREAEKLFGNIDNLEKMVHVVKANVDEAEKRIVERESKANHYVLSANNALRVATNLRSLIPKLFTHETGIAEQSSSEGASSSQSSEARLKVFRTEDFFENKEEQETNEKKITPVADSVTKIADQVSTKEPIDG